MFSRFFKRQRQTPPSLYEQVGGEQGVYFMANRFYDIMSTEPSVAALLAMHPQPLTQIRQVFFEFLSGWLGGPRLYENKYGHPRLRARHLPFTIDIAMRDQWLYCMYQVLDELLEQDKMTHSSYHELRQRYTALAHHMINQT